MKHASALALSAALVSLLAGCGTAGVTPDDLISKLKQGKDPDTMQSYEVNRSLSEVSATLNERATHCLAGEMTVKTPQYTTVLIYTPRVSTGREHTRLTLQQTVKYHHYDNEPKDGWYATVVDAYPAGQHKTRIEVYSSLENPVIFKAVRHWTDGSNLGCPDLTH